MTTENATNGGSTDPLAKLSAAGVSIWLDDLSRERLETGNLAELIKQRHVVGVTTNPTIFASALANGERYDEQLRSLVSSGASVEDIITELTTDDVRNACDVFMDTFEATGGQDGRVSIEVEPGLAFDTDGTLAAARMLYKKVDRPNLLIKIPATTASLPAITATIADGISVNVTLIFGLDRYGEVMNAYLEGLEKAKENGEDLSKIQSVASFFVSRVDSEIDKQLEGIGTEKALSLRGKAGIANARLAFERYEDVFCDRERWKALKAAGANPQRPLWASTGVKNPDYSDTMYVTELVARGIVNTMPEKTLQAVADHGEIAGDTIHEHYHGARHVMSDLEMLGIEYDGVIATLEQEGVDKFVKSWGELVETVEGQVEGARSGDQG